jgi:hypothetical protein
MKKCRVPLTESKVTVFFDTFKNKGNVAGGKSYFHILYINNIDETNFICCFYGCETYFDSIQEARRSLVRFPMRSLDFSIDLILPATL